MPKQKTRRSVVKRITISKKRKVMRQKPGKRHLAGGKSGKFTRSHSGKAVCAPGDAKRILRMLGRTRP